MHNVFKLAVSQKDLLRISLSAVTFTRLASLFCSALICDERLSVNTEENFRPPVSGVLEK